MGLKKLKPCVNIYVRATVVLKKEEGNWSLYSWAEEYILIYIILVCLISFDFGIQLPRFNSLIPFFMDYRFPFECVTVFEVQMENLVLEELHKAHNLVLKLAKEIDVKNQRLLEMEQQIDAISTSLSIMTVDKAGWQQAHDREMKNMQIMHLKNERLQERVEELEKRELQNDLEQKSLIVEMEKLKAQKSMENASMLSIQIETQQNELAEKVEELQIMEGLNQTLILKEHASNLELQEARKELLNGLEDICNGQNIFGIKRMGEVDQEPFKDLCLRKFPEDWELKSAELSSHWQSIVINPHWHPFKREFINGKLQEVIDEEDGKLKELKSTSGKVAFDAVAEALLELNEYNPSGRYVVPELWNFKEARKANLKEIIKYMMQKLKMSKTHKRRR